MAVVTGTQGDSQQVTSPHPAPLEASGARPLPEKGPGQPVPQLHRTRSLLWHTLGLVTLPALGGLFSPAFHQRFSAFPKSFCIPGAMEPPAGAASHRAPRGGCWRNLPEVSLLEKGLGTGQRLQLTQRDGIHQLADGLHDVAESLLSRLTLLWEKSHFSRQRCWLLLE